MNSNVTVECTRFTIKRSKRIKDFIYHEYGYANLFLTCYQCYFWPTYLKEYRYFFPLSGRSAKGIGTIYKNKQL